MTRDHDHFSNIKRSNCHLTDSQWKCIIIIMLAVVPSETAPSPAARYGRDFETQLASFCHTKRCSTSSN